MYKKIVFASFLYSCAIFGQAAPLDQSNGVEIVRRGVGFLAELIGNELRGKAPQSFPQQNLVAPPMPPQISPTSAVQANQNAVQICISQGMDPSMCQALNVSAPIIMPSLDDSFLSYIQSQMQALQPGETVSYFDLNYGDFMIVAALTMFFDRMRLLEKFSTQVVHPLSIITGVAPLGSSSLISKANLPNSTLRVVMNKATLEDNILPRVLSVLPQLVAAQYSGVYTNANIFTAQKGGVVLVFTQAGATPLQGRIRMIPHPETRLVLGNFIDKLSDQIDVDLQKAL